MYSRALVGLAAAMLCGVSSAQQITIATTTWVVIPAAQQIYTPYFASNGATPGGWIAGSNLTEIGTSISSAFFQANFALTGIMQGGPTFTGGAPSQTASGNEVYSRFAPGNVTAALSTRLNPASFINQAGTGYTATANTSVTVSCPGLGPFSMSVQANATPGSPGTFLTTAPQSGTVTQTGVTVFNLAMSSTASGLATMAGTNGQVQMSVICDVSGGVRLN